MLFLPFFFAIVLTTVTAADTGSLQEADNLFEDYFRWRQRLDPESASLMGFHDFDSRISDYSLWGAVNKELGCKGFTARVEELLRRQENLPDNKIRSLLSLQDQLESCVEGMKFKGYLLAPVSFLGNVQANFPRHFKTEGFFKLEKVNDMNSVIKRLERIPDMLDGIIETLKEGIKQNITFAKESMREQDEQFEKLRTENVEDSPFYHPFKTDKFDSEETSKAMDKFREKAKELIKEKVLPAYDKLHAFLRDEYSQHLRPHEGVWALPNGKEFYQACVDYHTTLKNATPEMIHEIGKEGIAEVRAKVLELAQTLGHNGTFEEFIQTIRTSPEFKFKSKEEVIELYNRTLYEKINPRLDRILKPADILQGHFEIDIEPTSQGAFAYYRPGSTDGIRNATFFVRLSNLENIDKTTATTITLHEANPGHHLELTFQRARNDTEMFQRFRFHSNFNQAPSLIKTYTAFREGWALYAESLGNELGVFDDPHQLMGYYTTSLWRSARLVVDTGIHYFKWTRQQAIDFMLKNVAISPDAAAAEIDRYITLTGQALSYKLGERAIQDVRSEREDQMGEGFDLRQFHSDTLRCIGSLEQLDSCIRDREEKRENSTD